MRRYAGSADPEEYLLKKHCLVKVDGVIRATPAGILCFGTDPQAIYPRAVVDIGHYRGVEPISFEVIHLEKDVGGTIFDQLRYVEDYLWKNSHHGMSLDRRSLERVEIDEYPSAVIRELIAKPRHNIGNTCSGFAWQEHGAIDCVRTSAYTYTAVFALVSVPAYAKAQALAVDTTKNGSHWSCA